MTVATVERGLRLVVFCSIEMALDMVDVGLLHHLEELARIGAEALDVAALALGIDGVEGERGFARTGEAGDHGQRLARDVDVDILEIVLARAADGEVGQHGRCSSSFVPKLKERARRVNAGDAEMGARGRGGKVGAGSENPSRA